jgi:hypothetical protein
MGRSSDIADSLDMQNDRVAILQPTLHPSEYLNGYRVDITATS